MNYRFVSELTDFIMLDFRRHDEADSVVTGDQANEA